MNQMFAQILGNFFGGGAGQPPPFVGPPAPGRHSGGIVGSDVPTFTRRVSPFAFVGAPRLHAGGIAGIRADEVPTILQRGEGVFTQAQMRALGLMAKQRNPEVNVNVHPPQGYKAEIQQSTDAMGNLNLDVIFESFENRLAGGVASRRSPVYTAMQGNY